MSNKSPVRVVNIGDASAVQEIYAPYVRGTPISFEIEPPTTDEMQKRIQDIIPKYPWLVYEKDNVILGCAYASQHRAREAYRWSVDVTTYVRDGYTRLGIGRQLYEALLKRLVELGYANAFAGIALPNPASIALHEAMGFIPIGVYRNVGFKLGAWHDVGWWQLSFQHAAVPSEPRAM